MFLLIVLFLTAASACPLNAGDWRSVDDGTLKSLPTDCFKNMTKSELSALSSHYDAPCDVFEAKQLAAIPPAAFAGMASACLGDLTKNAISGLEEAQIAQLTPSAVRGLDGVQMSGLTGTACSGFTKSQAASIGTAYNSDACQRITLECMKNFTLQGVSGFGGSCIQDFPSALFGAMSTGQVSVLNPSGFTSLDKNFGGFGPIQCAGLQQNQTKRLSSGYNVNPCSFMLPTCMGRLSTAAISGFQSSCVLDLDATVFSAASAAQIGAISPDSLSGLDYTAFKGFGRTQCAGLTGAQTKKLGSGYNVDPCRSMSTECLAGMTAAGASGIQGSNCLSSIPAASFAVASIAVLAALPPSAVAYFDENFQGLAGVQCSGFTSAQMKKLGTSYNVEPCEYFKPSCLGNMTASGISGITGSACLSDIPTTAYSILTAKQVAAFSPSALAYLDTGMKGFGKAQCAGFTKDQMKKVGTSYNVMPCTHLSADCFSGMTTDSISGITGSACLGDIPADSFAPLSNEQVGAMSASAIAYLDTSFQALTKNCAGLTGVQATKLGSSYNVNPCAVMTTECAKSLQSDFLSNVTGTYCLSDIPPRPVFVSFPAASVYQFSARAFSTGVSIEQLTAFMSDNGEHPFIDGFPPAELTYNPKPMFNQFQSLFVGTKQAPASLEADVELTPAQVFKNPANLFMILFATASSFKSATMNRLDVGNTNSQTWAAVRPDMMSAMDPGSFFGIPADGFSFMSTETIGAITDQQISKMPAKQFADSQLACSLNVLAPTTLATISKDQLAAAGKTEQQTGCFTRYSCELIRSLNDAQYKVILSAVQTASELQYSVEYRRYRAARNCNGLPVQSPTAPNHHHGGGGDSPSFPGGSPQSYGPGYAPTTTLGTGGIIAIIFGVIVVALLVVIIVLVLQKRQSSHQIQVV